MNFSWSDDELAFQRQVTAFVEAELQDDVIARDAKGHFARDLWQKCADFGILAMLMPKAHGGNPEIECQAAILGMEALGKGCRDNGLTFALNAQLWTVQLPIAHFGTEEQQARYLPDMITGRKIGAHVVTEPGTGSDAYALSTLAEKCAGGYRLNGEKRLISLAPIADTFLVFATINPKLGKWGVTAFLVDRDTPGVHVGEVQSKMGLRTVPIGAVSFKDCMLAESQRLGSEGGGLALSSHALEYERCGILASHLGAMEAQLDQAVAYASKRQQFGQAIGSFQSISNRVADMKLRLETARLLLYKVAWMKQQGESAMMEAALLKLCLSESFMESSLDNVRIHGGMGYLSENGVERDLRDAVGGVLYAGTSDIQRNIIARLLGI